MNDKINSVLGYELPDSVYQDECGQKNGTAYLYNGETVTCLGNVTLESEDCTGVPLLQEYHYCRRRGMSCNYATELGYCKFTSCVLHSRTYSEMTWSY